MIYVIVGIVIIAALWFFGKVNKAKADLATTQKSNTMNQKPISLSDDLRAQVLAEKRNLGPGEVIIKNRLGPNVMRVSMAKWQQIQTHMDAHMWDRLDDKV